MRIKEFILIVFVLLTFQFAVTAQESDELFTIYLIRHAEKELSADNPKDPPLTECGKMRAESIADFLKKVDMKAIYSTDYNRTRSTAQPTAESKGLELTIYDPFDLNKFAELLLKRKEDALVVGHSNTTGVLAGLLAGKEIGSFDETIYNQIYQVVIYKETGRLHILLTAFDCNN
ncbi:MAG: histidine phosphatase family protein [bacterium]|nr:histidine phosphatase family protein [bacterium]